MYWDWVADSAAPSRASVWDPVLGFGGNGVNSGDNGPRKRVIDGPFKNLRPVYWSSDVQPHWLSRDWTPGDAANGRIEISGHEYTPAIMTSINAETKYDDFRFRLESGPHAAVHGGVGGGPRGLGDLGFQDASPNGKSELSMFPLCSHFEAASDVHANFQIPCSSSITPKSTGFGGSGSSRTLRRGQWPTRVPGLCLTALRDHPPR
jgi:hypothetical protein